jgi:glyoxylase-like metal-dependent hydrolase (beta-lactamase superfamily II)
MPLIRVSAQAWSQLTPNCWVLGPQDVDWAQGIAPAAACILLRTADQVWLIDCGAGDRRQDLLSHAPLEPTQVLLTHSHPDHAALLRHWLHLPVWMSHANPKSWDHPTYVQRHWSCYGPSPLCETVSRSSSLEALPCLAGALHQEGLTWDAAVKQAILEAGSHFYGDRPPFERTMNLEELPLQQVELGGTQWHGWSFGDLWVLPSRGHAPDQVILAYPPDQLWILADETSAAPVWTDSDQTETCSVQRRVLNSLAGEPLLIGGHQNFAVLGLTESRQFLERLLQLGKRLEQACQGRSDSDRLYEELSATPWMQPFLRGQFPQGLFFAKQFVHNWVLRQNAQD